MSPLQLRKVSQEIASLSAEIENKRAIALANAGEPPVPAELQFSPCDLYARAVHVLRAPDGGPRIAPADIGYAIRLQAAKLKAGDLDFVLEALVGQATWLQAAATALAHDVASAKSARDKQIIGGLLLRFQSTATRVLEVLARIAAEQDRRTI